MMRAPRFLIPILLLAPAAAHAQITAKSAIIIDEGSGKVLWEKDPDTRRFPASTTKIMTAMLLLEHTLPTDIISAPHDVHKVKESSMHLKPFEQLTAKDMLYALMLRSANDGCYAVAKHVAGSVPAFSKMMNERAKQIGCTNTHFNNPNGLNDPLHTTTARDLALIAREAMKYETFREVVRTQKRAISRTINQKDTTMVNRNKWLAKDATADGIKTGYTRPAGLCYVGSATRNGFRVITSILKSENWQVDHRQLLDWAYAKFEKKIEVKPGDVVGKVPVTGGTLAEIEVVAQKPVYALGRKGEDDVVQSISVTEIPAPIKEGDVIGELILRDKDGFEQRVPVIAQQSVSQSPLAAMSKTANLNGVAVALGSLMFLGAYVARGRSRRPIYAKKETA
jgi:D-alanyl-D-alanine carboxypeptidase (penicillin-binding protein 5/6)